MGDSDVCWPVSSSDSSSESWVADSMDWGYESDETDPAETIMPLNWVDCEEVESQASNKPEPTHVDTGSFVGDSLEIPMTEHSSPIKEETRRGFTYGGVFWNETWEEDMDLYDDLDNWCCAGDESPEEDPEEDMDDSSSTSGDSSGYTLPYEG